MCQPSTENVRLRYILILSRNGVSMCKQKLPNCREAVGESMLDIQVYLNVLELMHSAAGGEGVEVLFRVLNRDCECPELLVIP